MKAKTTWILVADGAHARIVRQTEAEDRARLDDLVFEIDHMQLREIMSAAKNHGSASVSTLSETGSSTNP